MRSLEDRWKGGIHVYIEWMAEPIYELHRVLRPTGSIYLHCDQAASHYLKVLLDRVFGHSNFRNEVIWKRANSHNDPKRYGRITDSILYYGKTDAVIWNPQHTEYRPEYYKSHFKQDENGRYFRTVPLDAPRHGDGSPALIYDWKGKLPAKTRTWAVKVDAMREYDREGRIRYTRTGTPTLIQYADEMPGVPLQNLWTDIPPVNPRARERLGFPTQKPEALLRRIITASSDRDQVILDPFCGCGTTLAAANHLRRQWIGLDISPTAVRLIARRLRKAGADPKVYGLPQTEADLKGLKPLEFQNWVIQEINGSHAPRKTGDMGIDGFSFFERLPVQVKQSERVGRNTVDNFETAIRRTKAHKGYVFAFSFTNGAFEEAARVRADGLQIELVCIADLLRPPAKPRSDMLAALFEAVARAKLEISGSRPDRSIQELAASESENST